MTWLRTGILAGVIATAIASGSADADLLVYEPFNYSVGTLAGQFGGAGLSGAWADGPDGAGIAGVYDETTATTPVNYIASGGPLAWDGVVNNLPTTPSSPSARYVGLNQPTSSGDKFEAYRPLAQSAGDMAGGDGVLWASAAWHFPGQSFGAHVGLALTTDSFKDRARQLDTSGSFGSGAGDGIGVGRGADSNNLSPMIFDGGAIAAETVGNSLPGATDNVVILKFEFGATDTVSAFSFTENAVMTEAAFNTGAVSASFAINENTLNILTFDQNRGENAVDEIRIGDTFDDVVTGVIIPPPLTLQVDTVTGATTLEGDDDESIVINYYQILSAADSLNAAGWNSLADQDIDGNGPPDGSGNGWEEGFGVGVHALAEAYLLGDSTIAAGAEINLGTAYNPAIDAQDLMFRYRSDTGQSFEGLVDYVLSGIPGDYNNNGQVEQSDLDLVLLNWGLLIPPNPVPVGWVNQQPSDGQINQNDLDGVLLNWGTTAAVALAGVVPEPASGFLLLIGGLLLGRLSRNG